MLTETYDQTAAVEHRHWWYRARKTIFQHILSQLNLPRPAKILDIGCGTGEDFRILQPFGKVVGVDAFTPAVEYCTKQGFECIQADATSLPFANDSFNLVTCLDVLTCIENDKKAVDEAIRVCKKGGLILFTAGANPALWGATDIQSQNYRRYTKVNLQRLFPCTILRSTYFNSFLFPIVYASRKIEKFTKQKQIPGLSVPPAVVNTLLYSIFSSEKYVLQRLHVPFGVSLLLLARK